MKRTSSPSGHVKYYVVYDWDKRTLSSKLFLTKDEAERYAENISKQGKIIRGIEEYGY